MKASKQQKGNGKKKDIDYYLNYLIKLNSHKIPDYDEPTKLSKVDNQFLLNHIESNINKYKLS